MKVKDLLDVLSERTNIEIDTDYGMVCFATAAEILNRAEKYTKFKNLLEWKIYTIYHEENYILVHADNF